MLVSHRKRFIYTKSRKTAGTSVEVYFEPHCMREDAWQFMHYRDECVSDAGIVGYRGRNPKGRPWRNHMSAELIRDQVGQALWDAYFKFCVIRNPFDKLVSMFYYHRHRDDAADGSEPTVAKQVDPIADPESFRSWVAAGNGTPGDRNTYVMNGEPCVDYVIRYEELESGVRHVCDVLGIPFEPHRIPRLKAGFRPLGLRLSEYYDQKTTDIVASRFAFELERFGYAFPHE
jgi:hypothetical protein